MKVTFVYVDRAVTDSHWYGHFYAGVGYLSAVLKEAGHQTSLIHITQDIVREEFVSCATKCNPDLIAFSSTTNAFPIVKELAVWLKEERKFPKVICGGVHPTLNPEQVINTSGIDMICRGEGEFPLLELCQNMEEDKDITKIENLWIKNKQKVWRNHLRPLIRDLDTLPFPDRSIFDYQNLCWESQGRAVVIASRGCPYNCSYCCNHALRGVYRDLGPYVRLKTVKNLIEEIKQIKKEFPFIEGIIFDDEIFGLRKQWLRQFAALYPKEAGLPFSCNFRPNLVDKEVISLLKEAGCVEARLGIESGDDFIRNQVLNRNLQASQIRQAFSLAREAGINTWSFNMVGTPLEKAEQIIETIKLNAELAPETIQVSICQPYEKTRLYELSLKKGFLSEKKVLDFFAGSVLRLDSLTRYQIVMFRRYFRPLVRVYRRVSLAPHFMSNFVTKILDGLLENRVIALGLNLCYQPARFFYQVSKRLSRKG